MDNVEKLEKIISEMIDSSAIEMKRKIRKALTCGALDISTWDENGSSMLLPKVVVRALLLDESEQYSARGTKYEKEMKREVENLGCFL